jgi:3-hydroxy acid dehydrogenase/malonic semialdehyde reductase
MMDLLNYKTHSIQNLTALITGASSGIGKATALLLASYGTHINLVARREERINEIKELCQQNFPNIKVQSVIGDINHKSTRDQMQDQGFFEVDICINNAGLALGRDDIADSNTDEWDLMLQTNVSSAFKVIHACLPYMKKNGGDIVSISSIAGHWPYPKGGVYCATKAALISFMRSLRQETFGQDIRVLNLSPGMVHTEFSQVRFRGDKKAADEVYRNVASMTPLDMAHHILYMLTRPRHVNIDELITMSTDQGSATLIKSPKP